MPSTAPAGAFALSLPVCHARRDELTKGTWTQSRRSWGGGGVGLRLLGRLGLAKVAQWPREGNRTLVARSIRHVKR